MAAARRAPLRGPSAGCADRAVRGANYSYQRLSGSPRTRVLGGLVDGTAIAGLLPDRRPAGVGPEQLRQHDSANQVPHAFALDRRRSVPVGGRRPRLRPSHAHSILSAARWSIRLGIPRVADFARLAASSDGVGGRRANGFLPDLRMSMFAGKAVLAEGFPGTFSGG